MPDDRKSAGSGRGGQPERIGDVLRRMVAEGLLPPLEEIEARTTPERRAWARWFGTRAGLHDGQRSRREEVAERLLAGLGRYREDVDTRLFDAVLAEVLRALEAIERAA